MKRKITIIFLLILHSLGNFYNHKQPNDHVYYTFNITNIGSIYILKNDLKYFITFFFTKCYEIYMKASS